MLVYEFTFQNFVFQTFNKKPLQDLFTVQQTHSDILLPYLSSSYNQEGDGIYANIGDPYSKPMAIKTADCLPIMTVSRNKVMMIHAGWRGLHQKILLNPLLKSDPPHFALIGPCISKDSFEVTVEFKDHFPDSPYFHQSSARLTFDLAGEATSQLLALNPQITIEIAGLCTYQNPKLKSYRRDKNADRNWNLCHIK